MALLPSIPKVSLPSSPTPAPPVVAVPAVSQTKVEIEVPPSIDQSPTPHADAVLAILSPAPEQFPDPALLTDEQRIAEMTKIRQKILAKEPVSDEEILWGVRLIHQSRKTTTMSHNKRKAESAGPGVDLSSF